MRALFGEGRHPDRDAMLAAGASVASTRLGAAYPSYADLAPYPVTGGAGGRGLRAPYGRPPSATERNEVAAKEARRGRRPVAGYDLVFTPVKSASVLWALGGPEVAGRWRTRTTRRSPRRWAGSSSMPRSPAPGTAAPRRSTPPGWCARRSTTASPAAATRTCTPTSRSRTRSAASTGSGARWTPGTCTRWGWLPRSGTTPASRTPSPAGSGWRSPNVPAAPRASGRSARSSGFRSGWSALLQAPGRDRGPATRAARPTTGPAHGREPDRTTQLQLAQQATLETRDGKGPGRTLAEQVADWTDQAAHRARHRVPWSGWSRDVVDRHTSPTSRRPDWRPAGRQTIRAGRPGGASPWLSSGRRGPGGTSTPRPNGCCAACGSPHLRPGSESLRRWSPRRPARAVDPDRRTRPGRRAAVSCGPVTGRACSCRTASSGTPPAGSCWPRSGWSPPAVTSRRRTWRRWSWRPRWRSTRPAPGWSSTTGNGGWSTTSPAHPALLSLGIGPAGAGKTTAMRAFADAWHTANSTPTVGRCGGRVVPLATSAKAAQVLGDELGCPRGEPAQVPPREPAIRQARRPRPRAGPWIRGSGSRRGDVVLVDEAGMAGTLQLARLLDLAKHGGRSRCGCSVTRPSSPPSRPAAPSACWSRRSAPSTSIGPAPVQRPRRSGRHPRPPARATLRRCDFYGDRPDPGRPPRRDARSRLRRLGQPTSSPAEPRSWSPATSADVTALNARARAERVAAGQVERRPGSSCATATSPASGTGSSPAPTTAAWAERAAATGSRTATPGRSPPPPRRGADRPPPATTAARVRLPRELCRGLVELAYAATAHRVQGITVDTAHVLVTPEMTREALYVASTRGRDRTTGTPPPKPRSTSTATPNPQHPEPPARSSRCAGPHGSRTVRHPNPAHHPRGRRILAHAGRPLRPRPDGRRRRRPPGGRRQPADE